MLPKDFVGTKWQTDDGIVTGVLYLETCDSVVVEPVDGTNKGIAILIDKTKLLSKIN